MNLRLACSTLALAVAGSFFSAQPAMAIPNCNTCVPAYQACVASGATDCDTRYRVCLRYCPAALASAPDQPARQAPRKDAIEAKDVRAARMAP